MADCNIVVANAKGHFKADLALSWIGSSQSLDIRKNDGYVETIVIKIGDEVLATGREDNVYFFVTEFGRIFKPFEITSGTCLFRFFGLNIVKKPRIIMYHQQ